MGVLLALAMSASICMVALGALVAIGIFWIADMRGKRRPGSHVRRSHQATRPASRGHKPYRTGRVQV